MTDAALLVAIALATEAAQEVPAGSNRGAYVERILRQLGLEPGLPWCAAQVYDWGVKALGARWPLPKTGGCAVLAEFAQKKGVLVETPEVGDVFLIWEVSLKRFGHTGVVVGLPNNTISGNTIPPNVKIGNPREGFIVATKRWAFKPQDRFIRWTRLVTSQAAA